MCDLYSFAFNPRTGDVKVYHLASHSTTMAHYGLKDDDGPLSWREGHYLLNDTITARLHGYDPTPSPPWEDVWHKRWPTAADFLEWALANGADINAKDVDGRTALHWAAWYGYTEAVKLLLAVGADVNAKDDLGRTALHWAAWHGCTEVVALLKAHGAEEART